MTSGCCLEMSLFCSGSVLKSYSANRLNPPVLIVGIHALHAFAAIGMLAIATNRLQSGWLTPGFFGATEIFWFFVVGVWPVLYVVVYL